MAVSPGATLSDEQLADAIVQRERSADAMQRARDACGELYARHAAKLLAFLAARAPRSQLEDVHQEVWERVWERLPGGFAGGNFRAWLFQISRNLLIDQARKKRPMDSIADHDVPDERQARPDLVLFESERAAHLRNCLEKLAPEAAALVRARLSGQSYDEICERNGIRMERAHKLFHRAKEQLHDCVKRVTA
jgi:RNA polymerase sigma-70 factor (ECF subfamily)